jgi:hypothetical protein
MALPTDDDVPFALGCLGVLIWELTPGLWKGDKPSFVKI